MLDFKKIPRNEGIEFFLGLFVTVCCLIAVWWVAWLHFDDLQDKLIDRQSGLGVGPGDLIKAFSFLLVWLGAGIVSFIYVLVAYGYKACRYLMRLIQGRERIPRPSDLLLEPNEQSEGEMSRADHELVEATAVTAVSSQTHQTLHLVVDKVNRQGKLLQHVVSKLNNLLGAFPDLTKSIEQLRVSEAEIRKHLRKLDPTIEDEPPEPNSPEEVSLRLDALASHVAESSELQGKVLQALAGFQRQLSELKEREDARTRDLPVTQKKPPTGGQGAVA